jgi:hypothetical protein
MKFTTALVSIGLATTCAAQASPDSRFDGIWVGTEIVTARSISWDPKTPKPPSQSAKVTIAIAQGGTMVGVIGGFLSGAF